MIMMKTNLQGLTHLARMAIMPEPIPPSTLNLTASLEASIATVSPKADRSLQMRWNSADGMEICLYV